MTDSQDYLTFYFIALFPATHRKETEELLSDDSTRAFSCRALIREWYKV